MNTELRSKTGLDSGGWWDECKSYEKKVVGLTKEIKLIKKKEVVYLGRKNHKFIKFMSYSKNYNKKKTKTSFSRDTQSYNTDRSSNM